RELDLVSVSYTGINPLRVLFSSPTRRSSDLMRFGHVFALAGQERVVVGVVCDRELCKRPLMWLHIRGRLQSSRSQTTPTTTRSWPARAKTWPNRIRSEERRVGEENRTRSGLMPV